MELLLVEHPDFTLTIDSDNFNKVWGKALKNMASADNLVSLYEWKDDAKETLLTSEERNIENGESSPAIFFDNADYPIWVEFNRSLPVVDAHLSLPGKISKDADSNAKETFAFRKSAKMLTGFINYGNEIGKSYLRVDYTLSTGEKRTWQLNYEVLSTKLNYHEHWRTIITDIESEYRMLSLDFMRRTFHSFKPESTGESIDIIWWNVFQSIQNKFVAAVKSILNKPRHRLRDMAEYMRAERIKRFTPTLEEEYARNKKNDSHLYRTMQPTNSNDTMENRFLRHALTGISNRYHKLLERIESSTPLSSEVLKEMKSSDQKLQRLCRHPFFRTVGRFSGFTQESQVLQKASGYSQVYQTWVILNKSYSLEEGLHNLETKDIATLYEIWCFIQVKRIIEEQFDDDITIDNQSRLEMNSAFTYNLSKGQSSSVLFRRDDVELAELIYNPQESHKDNRNSGIEGVVSPTVPQRPDIVLQLTKNDIETGMKMTYLFDAKYRIDKRENGVDSPPDDAINQMHRYRDAIYFRNGLSDPTLKKEVIGGYILFPGTGESEVVAKAWFMQSVDEVNIGAFPLRPGETSNRQFLSDFISGLINSNARHLLTDSNIIPQKGLKYGYQDKADGDYVLIGYYDKEDWEVIQRNSIYYVRTGLRNGSLHLAAGYEDVKYLLLHSGGERKLLRLKGDGPRLATGEELREKGFKSTGKNYLVYTIDGFQSVEIDGLDINSVTIRGIGNRSAEPYILPIDRLIESTNK